MTTHTKQTIAIIIAFLAVILSMTLEAHDSTPSSTMRITRIDRPGAI